MTKDTVQTGMPSRLNTPIRFFGYFTPKDIIRMGVPAAAAHAVVQTAPPVHPGLVYGAAGLIGLAWWRLRPYRQTLDNLIGNFVRYLGESRGSIEVEGRELGYFSGADSALTAVLEVDPTHLEMQKPGRQKALRATYRDIFKSVDHPVHVYSCQQDLDLDDYREYVEEKATGHGELQESYSRYVDSLSDRGLTATTHYVVIRVEKGKTGWLSSWVPDTIRNRVGDDNEQDHCSQVSGLIRRCKHLRTELEAAGLNVDGLAGDQLEEFVETNSHSFSTGVTWTQKAGSDADGYRKSVYVHEFANNVPLGWPLSMLRIDGKVDVTQVIEPRKTGDAVKTLEKLKRKQDAELSTHISNGRSTSKLRRIGEEIDQIQDLLAKQEDVVVDYEAVLTAHSEDKQECRETFERLVRRLDTLQIDYRQPVTRTDLAARTENPLTGDPLDESLLMPGISAAAGFPFATHGIEDIGVVYGVDSSDRTPVVLDRWGWKSHSMARMGVTGSGKSYAAKLELLRLLLVHPNLQVYAVDPKQEYAALINYLGGTAQTLGSDTEYSFDSDYAVLVPEDRGDLESVEHMVDGLKQMYSAASRDDRKTLILIDEAKRLLEHEAGRHAFNQFVLEARDTNTAITAISQSARHFTDYREGRDILDNMPGKVLMNHDNVTESMRDYFDLSQQEAQKIQGLATGDDAPYSESLLKVSDQVDAKLRVQSTDKEHDLIISASEARRTVSDSSAATIRNQ
ncbi:helicase HerA domain-containing protein [Halobium salinum]|uniref:Helicase HerA domain-containing protein n=1 Tax=Halobium salinum TaxID=1364940 RepID=A0ABD5PEC9_9EURY|nr:DUF87 domain-containing protein [Halobium salinum]